MKKVLLSLVAMMVATVSFAQNALVASLTSGENTTYYYGVDALKQAVADAESGDVISLSPGSFSAITISKGITIRGAGIDSEAPTYIVGEFEINIPSDDASRFMMEGIRCDNIGVNGEFMNPLFLKCQFKGVGNWGSEKVKNIMFCDCKLTGYFNPRGYNAYNMINCFINNTTQSEYATVTATNCIFAEPTGFHVYCYGRCQFFNCFIISLNGKGGYSDSSGETRWIPTNSQAYNCYMVNFPEFDIFGQLSVRSGCPTYSFSYGTVFKTYNGTYSDEETFELTDDFKANYKGTDGKEVGLYGGLLPYNSTPSYPLITKMDVDEKTNDKGQLGVTIEVE